MIEYNICDCEYPCSCIKWNGHFFTSTKKLAEYLIKENEKLTNELLTLRPMKEGWNSLVNENEALKQENRRIREKYVPQIRGDILS